MPEMTVYAASKAALKAHTLNLPAELDGSGVTAMTQDFDSPTTSPTFC